MLRIPFDFKYNVENLETHKMDILINSKYSFYLSKTLIFNFENVYFSFCGAN